MPPGLIEPLPQLTTPEGSSCNALLGSYMDNLETCAVWGARYQSLLDAIGNQ